MSLYFNYGVVNSGKTLSLLNDVAFYEYYVEHEDLNIQPCVIAPSIDDRFGVGVVRSRSGKSRNADIVMRPNDGLFFAKSKTDDSISITCFGEDHDQIAIYDVGCVFVDECQFLSPRQIESLRNIAKEIDVMCYGLRTDFRKEFFPGSKRLMELADVILEVRCDCKFCNEKAIFSAKIVDGRLCMDGDSLQVGAEFVPLCARCYGERALESLKA